MLKIINFINSIKLNNKITRDFLPYVSLFGLIVLFKPTEFKEFGEMAWKILILIMFIRPLADILPKLSILGQIVALRKQLGIICGSFAIAHVVGFFLAKNLTVFEFFSNPNLFKLENFLLWGLLAFAVCMPLLLTSNNYSVRLLGKYWKKIQRLSYLFFIFVGLHIFFIEKGENFTILIILVLWAIVWFLSYKKIKIWQ